MLAIPFRLILPTVAAFVVMAGCSSTQTVATSTGDSCTSCKTSCDVKPVIAEMDQADKAKFEQDRQAILGMVGEFDVTFAFEETMAVREGYELKDPYLSKASEMVVVVKDTGDYISLQHLLVVTHGDKAHVVKHWRQSWQYQEANGYEFQGNNVWEPMAFDESELAGAWVQSVYQVDDSPRYWGVGTWDHRDGVSTWSGTANRPLPRREASKRKDYQILGALNTHVVTSSGWMHYQSNYKLDKEHATEPVISLESGVNTYAKTTTTDFSAAQEYWENTSEYWEVVRAAWADVYNKRETLSLKSRWKGDRMYSHIFDLADEYWGADDVSTARAKIDEVINGFRQPAQVASP
ncbi:MAG: DUF6607 family protein [Planctomycetota bacterium]